MLNKVKRLQQIKTHLAQEKVWLIFLALGAFLVRLVLMISFETYQFPTERDRVGYEMGWIATNLANGEGFKLGDHLTAWMAPLYPFLLSLIYRIFDYSSISSTIAILVLQSFISSLIVLPLYFIGRRLFGQEVGLLAAFLWTFHPASLQLAINQIWATSFTTLGLTLVVLLFLRLSDKHPSLLDVLLCGVVIGCTALSEPVILAYIPVASLWLYWQSEDQRKTIRRIALIAIIAILFLLPWTLRNFMVFHQMVFVKSPLGVNLWLGNYGFDINQPTAHLGVLSEEDLAYLQPFNEIERDKILRNRAITFIVANPDVFIKYTLQRIYLFWRVNVGEHGTLLDKILIGLIPLTGVGIILATRCWRNTMLLYLLFFTFPIIYYLTHAADPRYRLPIEGIMLIFVALVIYHILKIMGFYFVNSDEKLHL